MDQHFALRNHVGVTADGNLEPLAEIGVTLTVPAMRGGEIVEDPYRYVIRAADTLAEGEPARFIPGTRIVHASDARIVNMFQSSPELTSLFVECPRPTKTQIEKERKSLTDAVQESGTHAGDPDPTNPDNPDPGNPVDENPKGGE